MATIFPISFVTFVTLCVLLCMYSYFDTVGRSKRLRWNGEEKGGGGGRRGGISDPRVLYSHSTMIHCTI
jgi:hypothetical protein